MLNDIREWISDNLRYILLGAAGILLIVIIVFAVRLITGGGSSKEDKQKAEQTTEAQTDGQTEAQAAEGQEAGTGNESGASVSNTTEDLVRNQVDVLNIVTKYYTAVADKDYDTLAGMCEVFDDSTRTAIEQQDRAIESFDNIMTYSKTGLKAGSYVVYVYFDAKLTGIDTKAPTLRELYLETDVEGNLMVADESDPEVKAFRESCRTDADVQALLADVKNRFDAAVENDEALKNFVESDSQGDTGNTDGDGTTNGDLADDGVVINATTGTMQATAGVNVRGTPSADGTLYWTLSQGEQVEVLENDDTGWSKVRYITSDGTTIEGYVKSEYLAPVG